MRSTRYALLLALVACSGGGGQGSGSGVWKETGSMSVARGGGLGATLLVDGRVLVSGGTTNLGDKALTISTTETYDPAEGIFRSSGELQVPRAAHAAVLLPDGRVFLAGGMVEDWASPYVQVTASAEIYDPDTETSTPVADMSVPRAIFGAALLDQGRVLVAGGVDAGFQPVSTAEVFDPATGAWSDPFPLSGMKGWTSAIGIGSGRAMVVSNGMVAVCGPSACSEARVLPAYREIPCLALVGSDRIFVSGDSLAAADRETDVCDLSGYCTKGPRLVHPRSGHVIGALSPTRIMLAGGDYSPQTAEICDLPAGKCTDAAKLHALRWVAAGVGLQDGTLLVAGGSTAPDEQTRPSSSSTAERYHP
jgi:hypothetical protein